MEECTVKHLEFIQNIITRMNTNSFQIKGMSITIIAAILALYASSGVPIYFFVAFIPTILFWFLDAYYLQQERKFRGIYNDIVRLNKEENLLAIRNFEMPLQNYTGKEYSFSKAFWSKTIYPLYLIPCVALAIAGILFSIGIVKISFGVGN
jgi:hypothetical protein